MTVRRRRLEVAGWYRTKVKGRWGPWHAHTRESSHTLCGTLTIVPAGPVGRPRKRGRRRRLPGSEPEAGKNLPHLSHRRTVPKATSRVCAECAAAIGLRRRTMRAATTAGPALAAKALEYVRELGAAVTLSSEVGARLVRSARAAAEVMRCRLAGPSDEGEVPACSRDDERPKCAVCLAAWALTDDAQAFAIRTRVVEVGKQPSIPVERGSALWKEYRARRDVARRTVARLEEIIGRPPIVAELAAALGMKHGNSEVMSWLGWLDEPNRAALLSGLWAGDRPKGDRGTVRWRPTRNPLELRAMREKAVRDELFGRVQVVPFPLEASESLESSESLK